jgi:hypothetical protein
MQESVKNMRGNVIKPTTLSKYEEFSPKIPPHCCGCEYVIQFPANSNDPNIKFDGDWVLWCNHPLDKFLIRCVDDQEECFTPPECCPLRSLR